MDEVASSQSAAIVMDSVDAVTMVQPDVDDAENPLLTRHVVLPDVEVDTEMPGSVKLPENLPELVRCELAAGDQATLSPMPFNPRNPGLDPSVPDDVTVIGALNLFIPESMFELFTVETNRYRDQFFAVNPALKKNFNGDDMVRPITVPEMKTFFGIQVFAGVIRCTIFRELWYKESELLKSSLIARSMTYTRFRIIERFFHITNNEELPPTGTQEYKLARVQPVLQAVQKNCRDVYKANSKRLAIDEGCMGWKGHSSLRQYNPSKPIITSNPINWSRPRQDISPASSSMTQSAGQLTK